MIQNKKGVSDVISTVLIILLELAAVGIVGAIVLRSVGQSSQQIDTGTVCASTLIEVSACSDGTAGSGLPLANQYIARRISTGGYSLTSVEIRNQAGVNATGNIVANLPSDGSATAVSTFTAGAWLPVTSGFAAATYTVNGQSVTCTYRATVCG